MKSLSAESASLSREAVATDWLLLVKDPLSLLVLASTLAGFLLGWRGPMNWMVLCATLAGTAACACGAAALNQWWERDLDARMERTKGRPLPAGRMPPLWALVAGGTLAVAGVGILSFFTNASATFLAAATVALYVFVYTPMKRWSSLNTLVGAVPGAMPPLIGWLAAHGRYELEGCLLFAILWFWQMPHFLAVAWLYRDDYAKAGHAMLATSDPSGLRTGRQALLYAICLTLVTLLPAWQGLHATTYFLGVIALGGGLSWTAFRFLAKRDNPAARRLFLASIIYLPCLLSLLVATRTQRASLPSRPAAPSFSQPGLDTHQSVGQ